MIEPMMLLNNWKVSLKQHQTTYIHSLPVQRQENPEIGTSVYCPRSTSHEIQANNSCKYIHRIYFKPCRKYAKVQQDTTEVFFLKQVFPIYRIF